MNRRGFMGSIGVVVTTVLLPALPETWSYDWEKYWWRSSQNRIITDMQILEAGHEFWSRHHKPDIIVVSETFKKLFDECVAE